MELDKKTLNLLVVEKQLNADERSITSYVSKSTVDRGGDIVNPKGLDDSNYRKNPIVLFNHNYDAPVGRNLWLKKEKDGVLAKTQFAKTLFADDIFQLVKEGVLNAYSIGFIPKTWEWDQEAEIMTFNEWELLEYSIVSVPMNPDAINESLKMVKSDTAKELLKRQADEDKIKTEIENLSKENKELKSLIEQLQEKIDNPDLSHLEEIERDILKIKQQIEKKVETLDVETVKQNLNSYIVGEVSRLKKNNLNYKLGDLKCQK